MILIIKEKKNRKHETANEFLKSILYTPLTIPCSYPVDKRLYEEGAKAQNVKFDPARFDRNDLKILM
jgi:hypothetical protein